MGSWYRAHGKRALDIIGSAVLLLVTLPLQAAVAVAVAAVNGRPVLFTQERPGLHGEIFRLRKFRSMRAERFPGEPDAARLTRLGRFLRASSLDELPELWNVLRGDMSLVGPRPLLVQYLSLYTPEQARRHEVRPGITGLAQASGRNALSWEEKFELDLQYVDSISLATDLRILVRTLLQVLRRTGVSSNGHATAPAFAGSGGGGMTTTPLIVVGASGFGRETLDVIAAHNAAHPEAAFEVVGVLDDAPSHVNLRRLSKRGIRHLGGIGEALASMAPQQYVLAIGAPAVRERLVEQFDAAGWAAATVVHPATSIGTMQDWADGVVICGGVELSTNVRLGRHVHINPNATVGHDAVLGDFVSVNPAATISGEVTVARRTLVGAAAIVLQGLTVGSDTVVGAGSVVTKTVPDGVIVKGVPGVWG